jgi:hypothetical protein
MKKDQKFCLMFWDFKDQIDAEALTYWTRQGYTHFKYIFTGSDSYNLVGSNKEFTEKEALKALEEELK